MKCNMCGEVMEREAAVMFKRYCAYQDTHILCSLCHIFIKAVIENFPKVVA